MAQATTTKPVAQTTETPALPLGAPVTTAPKEPVFKDLASI